MIVIEQQNSRAGQDAWEGSAVKLVYKVELQGDETESDIRIYFNLASPEKIESTDDSPSTYTLYRGPIAMTPIEAGLFTVEINYFQPKPDQFSFSTGGGTAKTTYSRRTERSYNSSGLQATPSPNFRQGINVTKNAVEGVDIPISQPTFKVTRSYPMDEIDKEYLDLLEDYTGKINDSVYSITINGIDREYEALELKLANADGQTTENNRFDITYSFEVSRGIFVAKPDTWRYIGNPGDAGTIVIKDKAGWDYLWVFDEEQHDAAGFFVRQPVTAYVENVIVARDFSELKL